MTTWTNITTREPRETGRYLVCVESILDNTLQNRTNDIMLLTWDKYWEHKDSNTMTLSARPYWLEPGLESMGIRTKWERLEIPTWYHKIPPLPLSTPNGN